MDNTLTEQQKTVRKKEMLKVAAMGMLLGSTIMFLIMIITNKKETDKLKAKIFKLEGWQ